MEPFRQGFDFNEDVPFDFMGSFKGLKPAILACVSMSAISVSLIIQDTPT